MFATGVDILLHRLGGIDLVNAKGVEITVTEEETGQVLNEVPDVPFDLESGEILVACQAARGPMD